MDPPPNSIGGDHQAEHKRFGADRGEVVAFSNGETPYATAWFASSADGPAMRRKMSCSDGFASVKLVTRACATSARSAHLWVRAAREPQFLHLSQIADLLDAG